jgi:hypothetical protein
VRRWENLDVLSFFKTVEKREDLFRFVRRDFAALVAEAFPNLRPE